jgi:hypothetical protein
MSFITLIIGLIFGVIIGVKMVDHPQRNADPIAAQAQEEEESGDPEEPVTVRRPTPVPARQHARVQNYRNIEEEVATRYGRVTACRRGGCPYTNEDRE